MYYIHLRKFCMCTAFLTLVLSWWLNSIHTKLIIFLCLKEKEQICDIQQLVSFLLFSCFTFFPSSKHVFSLLVRRCVLYFWYFQITNKCRTLYSLSVFFFILPYQRHFKQMIIDVTHIELPPADFFKSYEGSIKSMPKTLLSNCSSTFIIVCTDVFLYFRDEINACDKDFAHWCKSLALAGSFSGFFTTMSFYSQS